MLVAACLGAVPGPGPGPSSAPPAAIRWGDCPERPVPAGMRCGTLEVPLDHAAPGKGTVEIALARIPATDRKKRIGSLLLNYGGPGAPGIASLAADPDAFADLGERYDLVAFDPRGVGHSEPVSCGGSQQADDEAETTPPRSWPPCAPWSGAASSPPARSSRTSGPCTSPATWT